MKKNISAVDRIIRVLIFVAVEVLYFTQLITGSAAVILLFLAILLLLTGIINFCPVYFALGINKHTKDKQTV